MSRLDEIRARLDGAPLSSAASWIVEVRDDISFLLGEVERLTIRQCICSAPKYCPFPERAVIAEEIAAKIEQQEAHLLKTRDPGEARDCGAWGLRHAAAIARSFAIPEGEQE